MDYLARESSPFDEKFWDKITSVVIDSGRLHLFGRRFLNIYGPLGTGILNVAYDKYNTFEDVKDNVVKTFGREYKEIPQIYEDFTINWRDIEGYNHINIPFDTTNIWSATQKLANKEDKIIFYGDKHTSIEGLLNATGVNKIKLSDWKIGENAYTDVVTGVMKLQEYGVSGSYILCVSPALSVDLHRIQKGTGIIEKDRIKSQLKGLFTIPILKGRQAVLLSSEPQYVDLVIGIDMAVAYLELKDLNHSFRILETILPRIKKPESIVVYE